MKYVPDDVIELSRLCVYVCELRSAETCEDVDFEQLGPRLVSTRSFFERVSACPMLFLTTKTGNGPSVENEHANDGLTAVEDSCRLIEEGFEMSHKKDWLLCDMEQLFEFSKPYLCSN